MVKAKRYKRFPSQVRYDKTHPTVSFRVSQEELGEIREMAKQEGKTIGDLVREALNKDVKNKKSRYRAGHTTGYNAGYRKAKRDHQIWYFCCVCGERVDITPNGDSHKAIIEMMKEKRWGHESCHNKQT